MFETVYLDLFLENDYMSDQKLKNGESPTQRARPKSAYYENSYYYTVNLTRDENAPFGIQLSPEGQHVDSVRHKLIKFQNLTLY